MIACIKANVGRQQPRVVAEQRHPERSNDRQQGSRFPLGQPGNCIRRSGATEPPSDNRPDDHRKSSKNRPNRPDDGQSGECFLASGHGIAPARYSWRRGQRSMAPCGTHKRGLPSLVASQGELVGHQRQPKCRWPMAVKDPGLNRIGARVQTGQHIRARNNFPVAACAKVHRFAVDFQLNASGRAHTQSRC